MRRMILLSKALLQNESCIGYTIYLLAIILKLLCRVYPLAMTPASDFSNSRKQHNREVFVRLPKLINLCTGSGMRVCAGEQCSEYAIIKEPYPCDVTY